MNSHAQTIRQNSQSNVNGWAKFAAYLLIIIGSFHAIMGLAALYQSSFYVVTADKLLVLDYTQWGWVHLITGIIIALSSISLFSGRLWGKIVAITLASISAIVNFGFIPAYPFWSILIIIFDIMVIYGVATSGSDPVEE